MINPGDTPTFKIDVHQHFWNYDPEQYEWISDDMEILRRDFLPVDLEHDRKDTEYKASICVQARQKRQETEWLLELAHYNPDLLGVVGWLDLCSQEFESDLRKYSDYRLLKGLRHVLHDEEDDGFMLRPEFIRGISSMEGSGLIYEILIFPRHIPNAIKLVEMFPRQEFVLDHCAKPDIRNGRINDWAEMISRLAEYPNISCKISGLVTEADWTNWKPDDFYPYLEIIWNAFGEERLMIGSDWPVCLVAGTYPQVVCLAEGYFEQFGSGVVQKLTSSNAKRIYML